MPKEELAKKAQVAEVLKDKKEEIQPVLTENSLRVLEKRYLPKDKEGNFLETPAQLFRRVAHHIAKVDLDYKENKEEVKKLEDQFYKMMAKLEFLPNSPTFWGAGTKLGQLSACFVLPVEDEMRSILKTQMDMGLIHKSGGGTGFSFSRLRPHGGIVGSTGGIASGPIGFMQMYNDTSGIIKEGGRRRGANMGMLRVDHLDILDFIDYKEKEGTLSNFNISVAVTNEFMEAVESDSSFSLIDPSTKEKVRELKANEIFEKIVYGAWRNGEPGIIFIDHINEANPTPQLGEIEATNPCGEQPLLPYESCNLGSINIGKMVKTHGDRIEIDWERFDKTIKLAVHFLNNVIDANKFPIPEIEKMTKTTRKIGLGLMGFADLYFQLNVPYDSEEGLKLAEEIMQHLSDKSHEYSAELAQKYGNFPAYNGSVWEKRGVKNMRNAATTTIAPTGTIGMIASASSGIEPIFALVYTKTVMDGEELVEVNRHFKNALKKAGIYSDELIREVARAGSIQEMDEIPESIRKIFVTAADISPEWHVRMQAALQKFTDNAISKTINFPNKATIDDVRESYLMAYHLKCKGLTVYRDGSRNVQILTTGTTEDKKRDEHHTVVASADVKITPRERPDVVQGYTYKLKTAYGKLYVTINNDENGEPFEVFSHLGKAGGFFAAKAEAITRLMSLALRSGIEAEEIIEQLKGIRGPTPTWGEDGKMILSLPDAIAQILEKHLNRAQPNLALEFKDKKEPEVENKEEQIALAQMSNGFSKTANDMPSQKQMADYGEAPVCTECGGMLEFTEGCLKCPNCGYSKCS
jgi:ribonucleoside-diphosphate reductase alpha chain